MNHLPSDISKRLEMVVSTCIETGYVNRDVLVQRFGLTPLQASLLIREFLEHHVNELQNDVPNKGYKFIRS